MLSPQIDPKAFEYRPEDELADIRYKKEAEALDKETLITLLLESARQIRTYRRIIGNSL